jgi:hypothetical protein
MPVGAAVVGVAVVGVAVVGNFDQKIGCRRNQFFDRRQAQSAPGHGSALEEFAYLNKQKGPHGAAPSRETSMLIGEQLQVAIVIVLRM